MDNISVYNVQEGKQCKLSEIFVNLKSFDKYILGYYDIELIEYINGVLETMNKSATYYGDECTLLIQ